MTFKVADWIRHPNYGEGQIAEDRGDKYLVQFVTAGERLMLKTAISLPGQPPHPGFTFEKRRSSGSPRFRVIQPKKEPPPSFDHLVKRFLDVFEDGFDGASFDRRERQFKVEAAELLQSTLSKPEFSSLLEDGKFEEIGSRARRVIQKTNLIFRNEIIKITEDLKHEAFQRAFALGLEQVLSEAGPEETRFTSFVDVLTQGQSATWTIATYFQFLNSGGEKMFMKPAVVKKMANSLNIALNYRAAPNWLTYCKLQELAAQVDSELRVRGLKPRSGIDVQGFIWSAIRIEEGKYAKEEA